MKSDPRSKRGGRAFLHAAIALAFALLGLLGTPAANAQTYPTKAVRMIVPFPPGGATDIMFSAATLVKAGKLKALGVTGLQREDTFRDVPTLDERGVKGFELYSTFGVVAPAGTPDAIVAQLSEAINKVLAMPAVRGRLAALGATPIGGPPQVFQKMIDDDYYNWGKVIRAAGIVPE